MKRGTLVCCDGSYAVTKESINGNLYFAYIGSEDDVLEQNYTEEDIDGADVITIAELEKEGISYCCG